MATHDHCASCFNHNCEKDFSTSFCGEGCNLMTCLLNCGCRLHQCKLADHLEFICSRATILCTNSVYGCNRKIQRIKMAEHLAHCPASVVTCSLEWNRQIVSLSKEADINQDITSHVHDQLPSSELDIALAQRDYRKLISALKMPAKLVHSLRNSFISSFPAVPLMQRCQDEFASDIPETSLASLTFPDAPTQPYEQKSPVPGFNTPVHCSLCRSRSKNDTGLADSITSALNGFRSNHQSFQDCNRSHSHLLDSDAHSPSAERLTGNSEKRPPMCLSLIIEMYNSFRIKPDNMRTFLCSQDLRRDQYSSHYKNIHAEIQSDLDGWFQIRCPLRVYGCRFTQQRFCTCNGEKIVFSPVLESFGVQPSSGDVGPPTDTSDMLSCLPDELLHCVLANLDCFSLKNVSLTSKRLREACERFLVKMGMVILDWQRQNGRWIVAQKVWLFSTVFHYVPRWQYADIESISNHIASCPYNMKKEYDKDRQQLFPLLNA